MKTNNKKNKTNRGYMTIEHILSLPKTLFYNIKWFPLAIAIKMPVFIRYNVVIRHAKRGGVILDFDKRITKTGIIKIGFGDIGFYDKQYNRTILNNYGQIVFEGEAFIGEGAKISCGRNGKIIFGNKFRNSGGLILCCEKKVHFYENVLVGWNTTILDSDYHNLTDLSTERTMPNTRPVVIGKDSWIAINSIILKGTSIPEGAIIGAGAVVHGKFDSPNILLTGNPAKIVKYNVKRSLVSR